MHAPPTRFRSKTAPSRARQLCDTLPSRQRALRTNQPLAGHNLTTARGRRVADIAHAYADALGNPVDVNRQAAIVTASELVVLAEEARTLALSMPGTVDLSNVLRAQNAADRAVRRLGLKATPARPQSLRDGLMAARPS